LPFKCNLQRYIMGPPRVTHGGRGRGQCALGAAPLLAPAAAGAAAAAEAAPKAKGVEKAKATGGKGKAAEAGDDEATAMDADDVDDADDANDDDDDDDDDALLTDVAKYVLASQGRWNASSIVSGVGAVAKVPKISPKYPN
jgi:hypothetical protein